MYKPVQSLQMVSSPAFPLKQRLNISDRASRASWVSTELFLTFPNTPISTFKNGDIKTGEFPEGIISEMGIKSITLLPRMKEDEGGIFRIWLHLKNEVEPRLIWDRKAEGGFPELKPLVSHFHSQVERKLREEVRNSAYEI